MPATKIQFRQVIRGWKESQGPMCVADVPGGKVFITSTRRRVKRGSKSLYDVCHEVAFFNPDGSKKTLASKGSFRAAKEIAVSFIESLG